MSAALTNYHQLVDAVEERILAIGGEVQARGETLPDYQVVHRFTPGLYIREITMPAGAIIVSRVHRTEHPYVVSKGTVHVLTATGWQKIDGPFTGITKAGTRRVLYVEAETVWTTFHVTKLTDPAEIDAEILAPARLMEASP